MTAVILRMKKPSKVEQTKLAQAKIDAGLRTKTIQRAANLLKQVSDPTRLQVISLLAERERHVGGLCKELTQSQPAVSHHLALLRVSGLIESRREGKHNFYCVRTEHFGDLLLSLFSAAGEVPRNKKYRFHDFVLSYSGV